MNPTEKYELQQELMRLFEVYGLNVTVVPSHTGIGIISHDSKVYTKNVPSIELHIWEDEGGSVAHNE